MAIALRSKQEIEKIGAANKIVAQTLALLEKSIQPGMSLLQLDAMAENYILSQNARPSFKGLYNFPNSVCTSVNEVVIHGIPTDYVLQNGDIVGLDIGVELDGWYGDAAITVGVGEIAPEDAELIAVAKETLMYAIENIKTDMRFKELSQLLEQYILKRGYVPLRSYCGHGIGRRPHEEPEIPNYLESPNPKQGPKIKNGMVFCIEPMICQKDGEATVANDNWSVIGKDNLKASHYEHTVAIVDNRAVILSRE